MLRPELKGLYQKWNNTNVYLAISHNHWIVELKWEGDGCVFGNGWLEFVKESGLEAGDTLVLFDNQEKEENIANVVICKSEDDELQKTEGIL